MSILVDFSPTEALPNDSKAKILQKPFKRSVLLLGSSWELTARERDKAQK